MEHWKVNNKRNKERESEERMPIDKNTYPLISMKYFIVSREIDYIQEGIVWFSLVKFTWYFHHSSSLYMIKWPLEEKTFSIFDFGDAVTVFSKRICKSKICNLIPTEHTGLGIVTVGLLTVGLLYLPCFLIKI